MCVDVVLVTRVRERESSYALNVSKPESNPIITLAPVTLKVRCPSALCVCVCRNMFVYNRNDVLTYTPARSVLVILCPTKITVTRGKVNEARYVITTGPPNLNNRFDSATNLSITLSLFFVPVNVYETFGILALLRLHDYTQ